MTHSPRALTPDRPAQEQSFREKLLNQQLIDCGISPLKSCATTQPWHSPFVVKRRMNAPSLHRTVLSLKRKVDELEVKLEQEIKKRQKVDQ